MNALKENNEKNKDEKEKNRRAEIVTRESLGAVGVVFSVLALLILFTRSLIFGEIGVTIDYFLLECSVTVLIRCFLLCCIFL